LTQFNEDVVSIALQDAGREFNVNRNDFPDLAKHLCCATEGLPALLVEYLEWIKGQQFVLDLEHEPIEGESLFGKLAIPYVESSLLSAHALVPYWVKIDEMENVKQALAQLVLKSSVFRLVTRSHLKLLSEKDQELDSALQELQKYGDPFDLFGGLPVAEPGSEMWHTMYPAIRRLLFRYQHLYQHLPTEEQWKTHQRAQGIYKDWPGIKSGTDLVRFLIEQLWHGVEYVRLSSQPDPKDRVKRHLNELLEPETLIDGFDYKDLLSHVRRRIEHDEELQSSLESLGQGFSNEILSWVRQK
jgi:hypothetical protein